MELTQEEVEKMKRIKSFFPYRKVSAVKTKDAKCEIFANATFAQANNYARKTGGTLNFNTEEREVNHYRLDNIYSGKALTFLEEIRNAMNVGNWDKSDIMTDYFNVGWYISIKIGKWNKPYIYIG
jgi:hypothetical protein